MDVIRCQTSNNTSNNNIEDLYNNIERYKSAEIFIAIGAQGAYKNITLVNDNMSNIIIDYLSTW